MRIVATFIHEQWNGIFICKMNSHFHKREIPWRNMLIFCCKKIIAYWHIKRHTPGITCYSESCHQLPQNSYIRQVQAEGSHIMKVSRTIVLKSMEMQLPLVLLVATATVSFSNNLNTSGSSDSDEDQCSPWFFFNSTTKKCQCYGHSHPSEAIFAVLIKEHYWR